MEDIRLAALKAIAAFPDMTMATEFCKVHGLYNNADSVEMLPPYLPMARIATFALENS